MYKTYTILEILCFLLCMEYFRASEMTNGIQVIIIYSIALVILYCLQKERIAAFVKQKDQELRESYWASYQDLLSEVKKKQHDFHNHLQALIGMGYSVKEYDTLVQMQRAYIKQIAQENEEYRLLNLESKVLSGFLYSKINDAWKKGISVKLDVNIPEAVIPIPEFVMVEILGILLDNAMEAVEGTRESRIYICMKEIKGNICISIANPVSSNTLNRKKMFEKGYSSKQGHSGYGLHKIREFSEDYRFNYKTMKTMLDGKEHFCFLLVM